uniref:Regulator of G protein signalling-like domain-containing protein n=1 Tax=Mola mola TaxID=94237 RepID=A0A3Q3XCQ2_MOLML
MDTEDAHIGQGVFGAQCSNPAMSIIGAEDEDFENDLNDTVDDQCTHFNSIDVLKDRPAHLLAFMQHVILQFDPAPLLCYLHADLFRNLNNKETRKHFVEFYNTFLDKGATVFVLYRSRPDVPLEETQRRVAQDCQALQAAEVAKQLDDFRQKRMMGMTPNEAELMDVESHYPTDRIPMEMKEKSVAENLLDKILSALPSVTPEWKSVAFYMKHLGVKTRAVDSKKSKGGFFRRQLVKVNYPTVCNWKASLFYKTFNCSRHLLMFTVLDKPLLKIIYIGVTQVSATMFNRSRDEFINLGENFISEDKTALYKASFILSPPLSNLLGLSSNRLEPPSLSDGGDVSPVVLMGGLTIGEPVSPKEERRW